MQAVGSFMCEDVSIQVAMVEFTFDLTGTSVREELKASCMTHFTRRVITDRENRKTFYIGSTKSAWSARIYQKTDSVTRIEYVLRSPFLRQYGIQKVPDLLRLRRLPIVELLRLRAFPKTRSTWRDRALECLTREPEGKELMLRETLRDNPYTLVEHPVCSVMRRMQGMFIW